MSSVGASGHLRSGDWRLRLIGRGGVSGRGQTPSTPMLPMKYGMVALWAWLGWVGTGQRWQEKDDGGGGLLEELRVALPGTALR